MTAPFVRVLVFYKLKLIRDSLEAVVVMKSGDNLAEASVGQDA